MVAAIEVLLAEVFLQGVVVQVVERGDLFLGDLVEGDAVLLEDVRRVVGQQGGGECRAVVAELPVDFDLDVGVRFGVLLGIAIHRVLRAFFTVLVIPVLETDRVLGEDRWGAARTRRTRRRPRRRAMVFIRLRRFRPNVEMRGP